MFKLFSKGSGQSPEAQFWQWFQSKSDLYLDFEKNQEPLFDEIAKRLHKLHTDLTFEFGPKQEGGRDFVISSDGFRDGIPAVEELVAAAPFLPGWKLIAFRPRRDFETAIEMNDFRLGTEQLWFKPAKDPERPGKIGLHLYIADCEDVEDKAIVVACFLLLDHVLGEYDVMTKVGFIERQPLPADREGLNLKPFMEMPGEFDSMYSVMHEY